MADPTTKQWYQFSIDETAQQESVNPAHGLDDAAVQQRLAQYGPNKLAEKPKEPRWKAFLRQYRDLMQIILLATGLISLIFM
ncbi:MAG TPA: cation-transporting P-type ATPase, partial [Gammaproteobacteria bacterium]|nr:cation-transporting P-type ATPase [Gammaproteobacteria bacterium]